MAEEHGGGLTHALHGKVGGIPAWGIGVGIAGVLILIVVYRNHLSANASAQQSTADTVDTSQASDTTDPLQSAYQDYLSNDPTNPAFPVGVTASGAPSPLTNVQWSRLAFDDLVAKGDDPSLVSNALTKYLSGGTLSAAEQGIVNAALTLLGAPPEGLLPVGATPPPSQTPPPPVTKPPNPPTPPPPSHKTYVVVHGDTLFGIAAKEHVSEPALFSANKTRLDQVARSYGHPSSDNGNLIFPGTTLVIP